jgi:hypothetical protein
MRVVCKKCNWSQANLSKSQAYDLARFEGCHCGGNLSIISDEAYRDFRADLRYDALRDAEMIAELENRMKNSSQRGRGGNRGHLVNRTSTARRSI